MATEQEENVGLSLGGIGIDAQAARAYLINVAETIQQQLLPQLQGLALKQVGACLQTTLHVAAALGAPQENRTALTSINGTARERALAQGRAFEDSFAKAEALIKSVSDAAAPAVRSCDAQAIERYLRGRAEGGETLRVRRAEPLPGGRSKQTILVSIEAARTLPAELVIRQDWAAAVTGTSVAMEFAVLQRLHEAGIRVPQPLLLETGSEALGAPFIVVSRIAGSAQGNLYDPPPGAQPVRELATQLGRTHALRVTDFINLPGIVERSYTSQQLREELARYRATIEKLGSPLPELVRYAMDWLDSNVEAASGPRTLVHGDVGFHNNLCDGEHLSAVLDWEMVHLGNPALDLGYIKTAAEKALPWSEFLALYHEAGGPPVDAFVVEWYRVYMMIWLLPLLLQARAAVTTGALHDIDYTLVCAHYSPALMAHLSRALSQALAHGR